ncbi:MAG: hypothetical protein AAFY71_09880 [Bacteroidota bacterium]
MKKAIIFFLFLASVIWGTAQPLFHHQLSESAFSKKIQHYKEIGYEVSAAEVYRVNGKIYYNAKWRETQAMYELGRNYTQVSMQKKIKNMAKMGYKMIALDGVYTTEKFNPLRYMGIWTKGNGQQQIVKVRLSSQEYKELFPVYVKKGYVLKHLSSYAQGGSFYVACIWEKPKRSSFLSHHNMSPETYQKKAVAYNEKGWYPAQISVANKSKSTHFAVIWKKKGKKKVVARHHLSSKAYQLEFEKWRKKGYRLQTISGYKWKGTHAFAAVWVK